MSTRLNTAVREVLESIDDTAEGVVKEPAKKPAATDVRGVLTSRDTSAMNKPQLIELGSFAVTEMDKVLKDEKKLVICKDMGDMATFLAEDEDTSVGAARTKLDDNKARAFTAEKTGVIYFLQCDETPHDMIHETVHVVSAPGGTTRIKNEFGDPLNEGFTEMFTKEICLKRKVRIAPAYPNEVAFVMKLQRLVGVPLVFQAYMKNAGMGAILALLSRRWQERSEALGTDEATRAFVAPAEESDRLDTLAARLKEGAFLKGEAKEFWDAILN
jgi:hypothetical protein